MGIFDNILLALASIKSNKMRSLLTMLGIIIGIGAVIAIKTVGSSLTGSITDSMSGFGASNITVSLTQKESEEDSSSGGGTGGFGGVNVRMFGPSLPAAEDLLTDAMIDEFKATFPKNVACVETTASVGTATVTSATDSSTTVSVNLTGVNLDYLEAEDLTLLYGRMLEQADLDADKNMILVTNQFVTDALKTTPVNAVGQEVVLTVSGKPIKFYIAGVLLYESESTTTGSSSTVVTTAYLPITTAKRITGADAGYQSITVVTTAETDTTSFMETCQVFFATYYTRNASYTVEASSLESLIQTLTEMLDTVALAISAIAAISLLVGGIGVMNIMMVSITERTREIGTRKALGAPGSAIRMQFIVEAMIICLIGGVLGVAVGLAMGAVASQLMGYSASPDWGTVVLAVGFSMAIGVFFGYYPAGKAAKMDPIEALRYE